MIVEFSRVTTITIWSGKSDSEDFGLEFFHPDGTSTKLGFAGARHMQNLIDALERLRSKNALLRGGFDQ